LNYLEDVRFLINGENQVYSIDFETRENCKHFFTDKTFKTAINDSNVDFYHISKGYEYIKNWFESNNHKLEILNTLLKKEYNVSIIWYETQDIVNERVNAIDDNSIKLFTRLNEGKIPLTDAELIKALLLQADLYPNNEERYVKQRLFEIASEWDEIEAVLQDEKMWLFINNTQYQPSSKIELIFSLLAEKWNGGDNQYLIQFDINDGKPKHFEYLIFDKYLTQKQNDFKTSTNPNKDILDSVNNIWKEIKDVYNVFKEWYDDHTLFHYIGYLLAIDDKNRVRFIKESFSNNLTKTEFIEYLKKEIGASIKIKKKKDNSTEIKLLNELAYNDDNGDIIKILLLFNVESILKHKKEDARFPFHFYKNEKITSIEHIHPQNPENINTDEERAKTWLESHYTSLKLLMNNNKEQKNRIEQSLKQIESLLVKYDSTIFKDVFNEIIDLYTEIADFKENEMHSLYNLALVDKDTNSVLNNSFFDVKREILKINKLERYIPICTQRAFSKYYSKSPQEMIFWNNVDRISYYKEIENVYNSFVKLLD